MSLGNRFALPLLVAVAVLHGCRRPDALSNSRLQFDSSVERATATPASPSVTLRYPFVVEGARAITVTSLEPGCSCLRLSLLPDKKTFSPGERAEVVAEYSTGTLAGRNQRTFLIGTAEAGTVELTAEVTIPKVITLSPGILSWPGGGTPKPQALTLANETPDPIRITGVDFTRAGFDWTVETVRDGFEYRLHLTPGAGSEPATTGIIVHTDCRYRSHASPMAVLRISPGR